MQTTLPTLISVSEAARLAGRDSRTIAGWVRGRECPRLGLEISGRIWVRREVLVNLIRGELDADIGRRVTA